MSMIATLSGTVTLIDSDTGTVALSKSLSVSFTGLLSSVANAVLVGTGNTTVVIPNTTANFIYVKNNHATQTLTVTWTPNGGSSAAVQTLEPGGVAIIVQPATGGGITAMALTASGASTPVEWMILG